MITFRTSTEVSSDRRVVLTLPPETPVGRMELVVMVTSQQGDVSQRGSLRRHFGVIHGCDPQSADNDGIDADLAREYMDSHDEKA